MANEKYENPINDADEIEIEDHHFIQENIIQPEIQQNTDVLVVGGGPIGLITAWGMKKLNPDLKVLVLEKYDVYQRVHPLRMDPKQLLKIIESVMPPEQFANIEALAAGEDVNNDFMVALWKRLTGNSRIPTNELEQVLKAECKAAGVGIIVEEVGGFKLIPDFQEDQLPGIDEIFIRDLGACVFYQTHWGSLIIDKSELNLDKETELSKEVLRQIKADILKIAEKNGHLDIRERTSAQIRRFNPKLVIGADGTHSVVNRQFFAENNLVKHPVDYALQLRFNINGVQTKADAKGANKFVMFQKMGRFSRAAQENVGYDDKQKMSSVGVQLVLTAEEFAELKQFTSKNPHFLFKKDPAALETNIPSALKKFINAYLEIHKNQLEEGQSIDVESIRISANELPATQVKENVQIGHPDMDFALIGDAAMGLSYFKGINAGFNTVAEFLTRMRSTIQNNFDNKNETEENLLNYQRWFQPFSDKKVEEVKNYSRLRVRPGMKLFKIAQFLNGSTGHSPDEQDDFYTQLLLTRDNPYPHRSYNPQVFFAEWNYVSPRWTFSKVGKYFADYTKPYKGFYQFTRDTLEPFSAFSNLGLGATRLPLGVVTLNPDRMKDGAVRLFRGSVQLATAPLTWTVKPLIRVSLTVVQKLNSYAKIRWIDALLRSERTLEETGGVKKLLKLGEEKLAAYAEQPEENSSYELLAICFDLHRKLEKAQSKNLTVTTNLEAERLVIKKMSCSSKAVSKEVFQGYLGLFQGRELPKANHPAQSEQENIVEIVI